MILEGITKESKMNKEKECEYGHVCTSGCQNDFDCPCQSDHCCSLSEEKCGECDNCIIEIPLLKGTLEKINNLTILKHD